MEKYNRPGHVLSKKKRSIDKITKVNAIVRRNDDCIEIFFGPSATVIALAVFGIFFIAIEVWIYIKLLDPSDGFDLIFWTLTNIIIVTITVLFSLSELLATRDRAKTLRFNRKTQEIYTMQAEIPDKQERRLIRFKWDEIEVRRVLIALGSRIEYKTIIYGKDFEAENSTLDMRIAESTGLTTDQDMYWEYIRRFMEYEPIDLAGDLKDRDYLLEGEFLTVNAFLESLPLWEQVKIRIRVHLINFYTKHALSHLKGEWLPIKADRFIYRVLWFILHQLKFILILIYPFIALIFFPAMIFVSWLFIKSTQLNPYPEEIDKLCGFDSLDKHIERLIKEDEKSRKF